jgi:integrase
MNPLRLTDAKIAKLTGPGRYPVGAGLYINVRGGSRTWLFRYRFDGRRPEMGLGSCDVVTLDEARLAALACRKSLLQGIDPLREREARRSRARIAQAKRVTFSQCFKAYCEAKGAGWSPGYAKRLANAIATYAEPVFGKMPIDQIDSQLVIQALEPVWTEKTATASKVRGWLETIFNFAAARGMRLKGDNPAAWRGNLEAAFAKPSQIAPTKHQLALPWSEVQEFFRALKTEQSTTGRLIELIVLTACRKHEAVQAKWGEFDLAQRKWTIPPGRNRHDPDRGVVREGMKKPREHVVALSTVAVDLLTRLRDELGAAPLPNTYVFCSEKCPGQLMSLGHPQAELKRMGWRGRTTLHGIRSSFQDFARETLTFPDDAVEIALAHRVGDKTDQAYKRSDLFRLRLALADCWANHCLGKPIDKTWVIPGALEPASVA